MGRRRHKAPVEEEGCPLPVEECEPTSRMVKEYFQASDDDAVGRLVDRLAKRLQPEKKVDVQGWLRFAVAAAALACTLVGVLWALGEKLAERPTVTGVDRIIAPVADRISRQEQDLQRTRDEFGRSLRDINKKLDAIKDRVEQLRR